MTKVLNLALLGPTRIFWQDQSTPDLSSGKAQALLAYLAVNGRTHARHTLADLLWGSLADADALRNLRGVVMKLRQAVGDYLLVTNTTLAFNRELPHRLDVLNFEELARQPEQLPAAIRLYRGDFLSDLQVRQAPAFEAWVARERTRLREIGLTAHLNLAQSQLQRRQIDEAITTSRAALTIDPIREQTHRLLMHALAASGRRAAALAQFEQCRTVLQADMGMAPAAETVALADAIRADRLPSAIVKQSAPPSAPPRPTAPPPGRPAPFLVGPPIQEPRHFFGRERILRRLFGLFRQRPLQNAAIIGPRRSGKTSLLHTLRTLATASASSLRPDQRQPWLPQPGRHRFVFVDFQDPRLGTLDGLLPVLLSGMGLTAPAACTLPDFLDIVGDELRSPTIILLDEIGVALTRYPELDDAFWESLRALASNQVDGNLGFVLASAQSPAELANHSGHGSPFFNIFGYTAVLGPLTEEAARALIASSPVPIPHDEAAWMLAQSERWPILLQLLCREYVLAVEDGLSTDEWRREALAQLAPVQRALTAT